MLKKWEFWTLSSVSGLVMVLVLVNITLSMVNRSAQNEISSRQQFIQGSIQLEGLYKDIVNALANLSVKNNDAQLKELLTSKGISITQNKGGKP